MTPITPQQSYPKLATALGVLEIYLKREDLHPLGSHKGRSIPIMIDHYFQTGERHFVISSSGNAALAAILYINQQPKATLQVFVGEHIDQEKEILLNAAATNKSQITISKTTNPKQSAFQYEQAGQGKNLRQSTDDLALLGYTTLADEMLEITNLAAIFIPTSSGTTAEGIFHRTKEQGVIPQIHIVQTSACHPMAKKFDHTTIQEKESLARAIVDQVAFRNEQVTQGITESNGFGWIISNLEIKHAQLLVKEKTGISISTNSALSIAALQKAITHGWKWSGPVVCLITGR